MSRRFKIESKREEFRNLLRDHFAERLARRLDPDAYPQPEIDRKYYEESALKADEVLRTFERSLVISAVVDGVVQNLGKTLKVRARLRKTVEVVLVLAPFVSGAILGALATLTSPRRTQKLFRCFCIACWRFKSCRLACPCTQRFSIPRRRVWRVPDRAGTLDLKSSPPPPAPPQSPASPPAVSSGPA